MTGRFFTRRHLGQSPEPDLEVALRPGEVLAGPGFPDGTSYLITEPLPPRWGLRRLTGTERPSGVPVELWSALSPEDGLPASAGSLLSIRHPHLQPVLAIGQDPRGHAVAVLRKAPGQPLVPSGRPQEPSSALSILSPVGRALDMLHAAGLCHLELRPEHLYVSGERSVVLAGLGQVAWELGRESHGEGSAGSCIIEREGGPPALLTICAYLAPEQILPERAALIHRRTDVYALSALAFHLLSGAPPFGPDGAMATLGAHLAAWRPLCSAHRPELGEAVDAVLQRGLSIDPQGRPPSCGELVDDLGAALSSAPRSASLEPAVSHPCVLVVAGSAAARREMQGMISAVSPKNPVLADGGAHAVTLALRYRPLLILLHQPSLPDAEVLSVCRRLCGEPALSGTQIVVQLQQVQGPSAQELVQLGVTIAASSSPSSASSPSPPSPPSARSTDNRPILQALRRLLHPGSSRSTTRRPGPGTG